MDQEFRENLSIVMKFLKDQRILDALGLVYKSGSTKPNEVSIVAPCETIDAMYHYITKLKTVKSLQIVGTSTVVSSDHEEFYVTRDITAKITNTGMTLCSQKLTASHIHKWILEIYEQYKEYTKNALGDKIYFFDNKPREERGLPVMAVMMDEASKKAQAIQNAPKHLLFTKVPFISNKRFENIFGEEIRLVEQRVNFFLDNKDWYDARGIPYQLGLLLSGLPGTGKTSIIRAIANKTQRHIININFSNITTVTQLKNIFFNEKLHVYNDTQNPDVLSIPIHKRLYVLEEIDAVSDIVYQRTNKKKKPIGDEITLGEILTVLDGTLEATNRIVIMTSNHPEYLDEAFIRPGRVDVSIKFGNATKDTIRDMYKAYLGEVPEDTEIPDTLMTAAEVSQVLFKYAGTKINHEKVIEDIKNFKKIVPVPVIISEPDETSIDDILATLKKQQES